MLSSPVHPTTSSTLTLPLVCVCLCVCVSMFSNFLSSFAVVQCSLASLCGSISCA